MLSVPQESRSPSRRPNKRARMDEATATEEPDPSSDDEGDRYAKARGGLCRGRNIGRSLDTFQNDSGGFISRRWSQKSCLQEKQRPGSGTLLHHPLRKWKTRLLTIVPHQRRTRDNAQKKQIHELEAKMSIQKKEALRYEKQMKERETEAKIIQTEIRRNRAEAKVNRMLANAAKAEYEKTKRELAAHREGDFAGNTKRVVLANKYGDWPQGPKLWADLKLHSYNVHWVYWTIDWAGQRYVVHEQGGNTALGAHWRRWMGPAQGYQDVVLAFTWDPTDRRDPANNLDIPFLPQVDEYPHVAPYYEDYFDTDSDEENEEHADTADPDAPVPRNLDDQVLPEETLDDDATISETSDSVVEVPATLAPAIKRSKAKTIQDSEDELEDDTEEEIEERPSKRTKTSVKTPTPAGTSSVGRYTIPRVRNWKKRPRRTPAFKIFDQGEYEAAQVSSSV
ncbi:MAG: hypothetical protein Q9178_004806 [Gyalolechia marmorata]